MNSARPLCLPVGVLLLAALLIVTGVATASKLTWLMEVLPVLIVVPILWATARRYPLTPLLYVLISSTPLF